MGVTGRVAPLHADAYHAREWPRGHRGTRAADQAACTAEFELSAAEEADLLGLTATSAPLRRVRVTRDHGGTLTVGLPPSVPDEARSGAHDYVVSHLPTFVYLDDYGIFRGRNAPSRLVGAVLAGQQDVVATSIDLTAVRGIESAKPFDGGLSA